MSDAFAEPKAMCKEILEGLGLLKREHSELAIFAFYYGYYKGDLPAYVTICLMSGRHSELVA
jgi:hypothetical protein